MMISGLKSRGRAAAVVAAALSTVFGSLAIATPAHADTYVPWETAANNTNLDVGTACKYWGDYYGDVPTYTEKSFLSSENVRAGYLKYAFCDYYDLRSYDTAYYDSATKSYGDTI